jgi:hypothetical protein
MPANITITTGTGVASYSLTTSGRGPAGPPGADGNSANITAEAITDALGYVPADADNLPAVDNAAVNAAIEQNQNETLKSARAVGHQRLIDGNKAALSRWWLRRERDNTQFGGLSDQSKLRVMDMGDSMTVPFGAALAKYLGYGGEFIKLNTLSGTGITSNGSLLLDQWDITPFGHIHRLANTNVLEVRPTRPMTGIYVHYLAKPGGGSIQMSFQTNKTGAYTNSAQNWVVDSTSRPVHASNGHATITVANWTGIRAGMTVTGANVPGGTTVVEVSDNAVVNTTATTNNTATVTVASVVGIAPGMRVESPIGSGLIVSSINQAANQITFTGVVNHTGSGVTLTFRGRRIVMSAAPTGEIAGAAVFTFANPQAGSSTGGTGILHTDNTASGGSQQFCSAYIPVPNGALGADYYNIRLTATGTVDLLGFGTEKGGFGFAQSVSGVQPGSVHTGNYGEGGKLISTHFNQTPQDAFSRALGWIDPEIITFKGLNDWGLATLTADVGGGVTRWDQYMGKIHAAAPRALVLIFSSNVTHQFPDPAASGYLDADEWVKDWCAKSGFAMFVDVRQNSLLHESFQGSLSNMSSDGLHQYTVGSDLRGFGEHWSAALALMEIFPALHTTGVYGSRGSGTNANRYIPGDFTGIRLSNYDPQGVIAATSAPFYLDVPPRSRGAVLLRPAESVSGGTYGFSETAGFGQKPLGGGSGANPGALRLISAGNVVAAFGNNHFSGNAPFGALFGAWSNTDPADARTSNGWRFLQPVTTYGQKDGLIAEGRAGATNRLFGVDIAATEAAAGTALWGWFADGRLEYEGTNFANGFKTTFITAEPTSNVTVTTPVKTGTVGVVPAYADQTAATGAGLAAGDNYWNTTTNSLKTIMP